jgi:membrane peptidoglycan carboxypeptidase
MKRAPFSRPKRAFVGLACVGGLAIAAGGVVEARTSFLQSLLFTRWANAMTFSAGQGPSPRIRFPSGGPYDERLGYSHLPAIIHSLTSRHFVIERQAEMSPALDQFTARHGYALYHEKNKAGLVLHGRDGAALYQASYPERLYNSFSDIPPVVAATLLYIENRTLLDVSHPRQNPAVEWQRFFVAAAGQLAGAIPQFAAGRRQHAGDPD